MAGRPVPLVVPLVTGVLLIGTASVMTAQKLALTADGAYFLVRVIGDEKLFGPPGRIFAEAARQLPVLFLVWGGETNTATLSIAHGVGQLVLPALVWCVAIILARGDSVVFFAVASTSILCAGSTWLFSVSEAVLAVPLAVLLAILLWLPRWRPGHVILGCACSILLVSSYETAALIGTAFTAWGIVRLRRATSRLERYSCALIAAASCASVIVAIVGASGHGPGPDHARGFAYYLVSLEPWPFYVAFAGVAAIVAGLDLNLSRPASGVLIASGTLLLGFGAMFTETTVSAAYEARAGTCAASFALLLYLWWRWASTRRGRRERLAARTTPAWVTFAPILLAGVVALLMLDASKRWERDFVAFRGAVTTNTGIVWADQVVPPDRDRALWDWTSLYLSLVARSGPDDALLIARKPSYVPFTPQEARERLPDQYTWR